MAITTLMAEEESAGVRLVNFAAYGRAAAIIAMLRRLLGPFLGLVLVFAFFIAALHLRARPGEEITFYTATNLRVILLQTVIIGIASLGMTLVIVSGGIDLSVGSQLALGTVAVAWTLARVAGAEAAEASAGTAALAAAAGIGVCTLVGLVNGLVSTGLRLMPFIVTLGTMQIARGIANWWAAEQMVMAPKSSLGQLMLLHPQPPWLWLSPGVWLLLGLAVVVHIVLRYTVFGRYTLAVGSNEATARICGINVGRQRVAIYTLCGALTGVAGVMLFSSLSVGSPTEGIGAELEIIAAVVIGGGSLAGGEGSAIGTLVGALIMAVLRNGCTNLGVSKPVQDIVIGLVIIGAVAADRLRQRRGE
ncbi:MAG: ABC transporter permease [Planctomycetota bacterium]|nr:ABC transporter permease [Planctomycetota bacterium]